MTVCLSLIFSSKIGFIWNTFSLSLVVFWKNGLQILYQNFSTQMTLAKVTKWPWPLAYISNWHDFISIPKSTITTQKWKFLAFQFKCPWNQNWPCRKIGQGQPTVMIYIIFVVLQTLMLHAKFQGNFAQWFWRRRFFKVLSIFEHGGHLGHVTWTIYIIFLSPFPRRLHIKFACNRPSGFGEDVWKCERTTTDDDAGRRDHWYTISSPTSFWPEAPNFRFRE